MLLIGNTLQIGSGKSIPIVMFVQFTEFKVYIILLLLSKY